MPLTVEWSGKDYELSLEIEVPALPPVGATIFCGEYELTIESLFFHLHKGKVTAYGADVTAFTLTKEDLPALANEIVEDMLDEGWSFEDEESKAEYFADYEAWSGNQSKM